MMNTTENARGRLLRELVETKRRLTALLDGRDIRPHYAEIKQLANDMCELQYAADVLGGYVNKDGTYKP